MTLSQEQIHVTLTITLCSYTDYKRTCLNNNLFFLFVTMTVFLITVAKENLYSECSKFDSHFFLSFCIIFFVNVSICSEKIRDLFQITRAVRILFSPQ